MFAGILLKTFWYLYKNNDENEDCVKTTVANQCMSVGNQVSTFLSLVNKDLLVKNIVFTTNIPYLWKATDFQGVIL